MLLGHSINITRCARGLSEEIHFIATTNKGQLVTTIDIPNMTYAELINMESMTPKNMLAETLAEEGTTMVVYVLRVSSPR